MYAYLIGNLVLLAIFSVILFVRKDLRKLMIYSGLLYAFFMTFCFIGLKLISSDPAKSVAPGYWSPPTIFGLNQRTGGEGIEDLMFMFFAPAIIAGLYELVFNVKVGKRRSSKLKRGHALLIGVIAGFAIFAFTPLNAIYFLIIAQFVGAAVLVLQRRDLLKHAISGGILFLAFYFLLFSLFNLLFPAFISNYYHLNNTTHILILGIPLEEYIYVLSLGLMWAPIYEYEHGIKDSKRRSSKPRRVFLAAASSRR